MVVWISNGNSVWILNGHSNGHSHVNVNNGNIIVNGNVNGVGLGVGVGHSSRDYGNDDSDDDFDDRDHVATSQQPHPHPHPHSGDNALVSLLRSYLSLVKTVAKQCVGGLVGQKKGLASGQGLGGQGTEEESVPDRGNNHQVDGTQPSQQPPLQIGPGQNVGTVPSPSPGPSPGPSAGAAWSGSSLLDRLAAFNLQAYRSQQQQQQRSEDAIDSPTSPSSSSNHLFNMVPYLSPLGQQEDDAGLIMASYDEWRGVRQHGQGLGPGPGLGHHGYYRPDNGQEGTIRSSSSSVDNSEHSSILLLPAASRPYGLAYLGSWYCTNPNHGLTLA